MDLPARQRGTRVPDTGMDPERRGPVLVAQTPQTESASRWTRTQFSATPVLHCISLWPGGDWYPPRAVMLLMEGGWSRGFHIQNVNVYSCLKEWLEWFHVVATKYLPNYLG